MPLLVRQMNSLRYYLYAIQLAIRIASSMLIFSPLKPERG